MIKTPFEHLLGNERAKEYLSRMLNSQRIGNSYLFAGPEGIGKGLFAQAFAKELLHKDDAVDASNARVDRGLHPDMHIYRPEGKIGMHSIASIRQLIDEVHLPPYEGKRKVFIIHDAERMLPDSANSLLKTFEEPTLDSLIILISSSPEMLLPTIASRCQVLYFQPIEEAQITAYLSRERQASATDAERVAQLAKGSIGRALHLLNPEAEQLRTTVLQILASLKDWRYPDLLKALRELNEQMEAKKKAWDESIRKELVPKGKSKDKQPTAAEQEMLQKEIDGFISLNTLKEVDSLLEVILGWYRDLHLAAAQGNLEWIIHKDFQKQIIGTASYAPLLSLEDVMRGLAEAKTAFSRSAPFQTIMETLFLKFLAS